MNRGIVLWMLSLSFLASCAVTTPVKPSPGGAPVPLNRHNACSRTRENSVERVDAAIAEAAGTGDVKAIEAALRTGASANGASGEGFTLLHTAVTNHQDDVIRLLLANGADVNLPFNGSSPLALARMSSGSGPADLERKRMLVAAGAALSDSDVAFQEILTFGTTGSSGGFVGAISRGDLARVRIYVRNTYDIDAPISKGVPPLHIAAAQGPVEVVSYLIQCGANVNARTDRGAPVLWFAKQRPEVAELLRRHGARDDR